MRLCWANGAGHRLLGDEDILTLDDRGGVQARGSLQWKIERAIKSRAAECVIFPDEEDQGIGENLVVTVEMLADEDGDALFGIQILNHDSALAVWIDRLAKQFRLTPKQAQILFQMINRSEEHTSELPSLMRPSFAVLVVKK